MSDDSDTNSDSGRETVILDKKELSGFNLSTESEEPQKICITTWCHDQIKSLSVLFPDITTDPETIFSIAVTEDSKACESEIERVASNFAARYICFGLYQLRLTESNLSANQLKEFIHKVQEAHLHLITALRAHEF